MRWIVYVLLVVTGIVLFSNRILSQRAGSLAGEMAHVFHQDQTKMGVAETEAERREIDEQMFNNKPQEPVYSFVTAHKEDLTVRASLWEPRLQALNRAVDSDVIDLLGRLKEDMALLDDMVRTRSIPEIAREQVEKAHALWGEIRTIYGVAGNKIEESASRIPSVITPACSSDTSREMAVLTGKEPGRAESDDKASAAHIDACRQTAMQGLVALDEKMRVLGERLGELRLRDRGMMVERMEKHRELVERVARVAEKGYQIHPSKDVSDQIEQLRLQQERNKDRLQQMQRRNIMDPDSRDKMQAMQERLERIKDKVSK